MTRFAIHNPDASRPDPKLGRKGYTDEQWSDLVQDGIDDEELRIALRYSNRKMFTDDEWADVEYEGWYSFVGDEYDAVGDFYEVMDQFLDNVDDGSFIEDQASEYADMYWDADVFEGELKSLAERIAEEAGLEDDPDAVEAAFELVNSIGNFELKEGSYGDIVFDFQVEIEVPDDVTDAAAQISDEAIDWVLSNMGHDWQPYDDSSDLRRAHEYESGYWALDMSSETRSGLVDDLKERFPSGSDYFRHDLRELGGFAPELPSDKRAFPWLDVMEGLDDFNFEIVELGSYEDIEAESNWLGHCLSDVSQGWPEKFSDEQYSLFSIRPTCVEDAWNENEYTGKQWKKVLWTLPHFTVAAEHSRTGELNSPFAVEHILGYHNRDPGTGPAGSTMRPWEIKLVVQALGVLHASDDRYAASWRFADWDDIMDIYADDPDRLNDLIDTEHGMMVEGDFAKSVLELARDEFRGRPPSAESYWPEGVPPPGRVNPDEGSCPHCGGPRKGFCAPPRGTRLLKG